MFNKKKILAIIPARADSKEIPKKNVKILNGKSLIGYTIETCLASRYIDDIFVSTENEEIKNIARRFGAKTVDRPEELSKDSITLDSVTYNALKRLKGNYNYVLTIQPTSPLLEKETIDKAIRKMVSEKTNSVITLCDRTGLYWKEEKNKITPCFKKRLNRQQLNKCYIETGAIIGCKSDYLLKTKKRIDHKKCSFVILNEREAVDINSYSDWMLAREVLNLKNIAINVVGNEKTGLGHIYRQLTLASYFDSRPLFFVKKGNNLALNKIRLNNYPAKEYRSEKELMKLLRQSKSSIIINDVLNTREGFIKNLKKTGLKIINFEDIGEGADLADLVFNALYEFTGKRHNTFYGYKYTCLREDVINSPKKRVEKEVKNILITCGGTDQNNFTIKYLESLQRLKFNKKVTIIIGVGYAHLAKLRSFLKKSKLRAELKRDVFSLAKYIHSADLVLTSNGRTVYEICCIGTPCIALCQNELEMRHSFGIISGALLNFGLGTSVSSNKLDKELGNIIKNYSLRKRLNKKMIVYKLEDGVKNIIGLIEKLKGN